MNFCSPSGPAAAVVIMGDHPERDIDAVRAMDGPGLGSVSVLYFLRPFHVPNRPLA